jgi:hypothetical protein
MSPRSKEEVTEDRLGELSHRVKITASSPSLRVKAAFLSQSRKASRVTLSPSIVNQK